METLLVAALLVASSIVLAAVFRLPLRAMRAAATELLEFAGLWGLCLVSNVALGAAVILLLRTFTPLFVSIYVVNDVSVVVVSALQALVVHAVRRR